MNGIDEKEFTSDRSPIAVVNTFSLVTEVAAPIAGGLFGIRLAIARAVVRSTQRRAIPAIDAYRRHSAFLRPLPAQYRQAAEDLRVSLRVAQDMRTAAIAIGAKLKLPNLSLPDTIPELQTKMETAGVSMLDVLRQMYSVKFSKLVIDQVRMQLDADPKLASDIAAQWNLIESNISRLLDHFGVLDAIHAATQSFVNDWADISVHLRGDITAAHGDAARHHLAEATNQQTAESLGFVSDVLSIPGIVSATKNTFKEFDLLLNDKTTLEDSVAYGFIPIAVQSVLTLYGAAIEAAFGFVTCGLITAAMTCLGKFITNAALIEELNDLIARLEQHKDAIRKRHSELVLAINAAVADALHQLRKRINLCPDIGDDHSMRSFTDHLQRAYNTGVTAGIEQSIENVRAAIRRLRPRNWVDHLLFIDRREVVSDLYWQAHRELASQGLGAAHSLAIATETHVQKAVEFILDNFTCTNEASISAFDSLVSVRAVGITGSVKSLNHWEADLTSTYKTGAANVAAVTAAEHRDFVDVKMREEAAMEPLRNSIYGLTVRLGLPETPL